MFGMLPPVTRGLIIANVVVYLLQLMVGNALIIYLGLWPLSTASVYGGMPGFQPWQIVTYGFLHGSAMHIFVNMFALYMFGGQLERLFGPKRFLNLYLASIIAAGLSQLAYAAFTGADPYPTIGASGGVFGILLAFAMYFPRQTIVLLIPPIPMPAWLFVTLYGLVELFLGVSGMEINVAHFAHLGGMLGAWLLIQYWRGRPPFGRRR
ncbi:MAG TPA: rhomboid family intramembrane serine protease [Burkholderiales bacterium]|nr:rhomboid family intramembrane serine protease [Burkholderiales bacterium]